MTMKTIAPLLRAAALTFAIATACAARDAGAATLQVSPVGLDIAAPGNAGSVRVTNRGTEALNLQLRLFQWAEDKGQETMTATEAVIVSPPAARLEPGQTYTVRVLRLSKAAPIREEAYRLLIDELPTPVDPRTASPGVRIVTRTSLPVFFSPAKAVPAVTWGITCEGSAIRVRGDNAGIRHAQVQAMTLTTDTGAAIASGPLNEYLLAGSMAIVTLPLGDAPCPARAMLAGVTNAGPFQQGLPAGQR